MDRESAQACIYQGCIRQTCQTGNAGSPLFWTNRRGLPQGSEQRVPHSNDGMQPPRLAYIRAGENVRLHRSHCPCGTPQSCTYCWLCDEAPRWCMEARDDANSRASRPFWQNRAMELGTPIRFLLPGKSLALERCGFGPGSMEDTQSCLDPPHAWKQNLET